MPPRQPTHHHDVEPPDGRAWGRILPPPGAGRLLVQVGERGGDVVAVDIPLRWREPSRREIAALLAGYPEVGEGRNVVGIDITWVNASLRDLAPFLPGDQFLARVGGVDSPRAVLMLDR